MKSELALQQRHVDQLEEQNRQLEHARALDHEHREQCEGKLSHLRETNEQLAHDLKAKHNELLNA